MITVVATGDGSNTVFNSAVGEQYHSRHGALTESRHVFIEAGLRHFLARSGSSCVRIFEVGFGTGLNYLLTFEMCRRSGINLSYTAVEAWPLPWETLAATGYESLVIPDAWKNLVDTYAESLTLKAKDGVVPLEIVHGQLETFSSSKTFDIVYFDAFSARHQPELWTRDSLTRATQNLHAGGIFVTYAITGELKRNLVSLDFTIEKLPGAPGKREMLRAIKK